MQEHAAGKWTLIANWVYGWRNAHPNHIIFEHFLGASPDSADPVLLMGRLWEQLNRATGEIIDIPNGNIDLMDLAAALARRIAEANAFAERNGQMILLVLDGLDKLSSEQDLRWLSDEPRVKVLASSLDGAAKKAALMRGWTEVNIEPLTDAQRRNLVERRLEIWGRELAPGRVERIVSHGQAGSPLFLKTVLDELRVSATHSVLDDRLDDYLSAVDMPDLFDRVVKRIEWVGGTDLTQKVLSLIWASRAGLEETEIIALTGAKPLFLV